MSAWKIVVDVCLPVPLILLFFLSVPFPKFFRRQVLRLTNNVMSFAVGGRLHLVHVMLGITGTCFLVMLKNSASSSLLAPTDQALTPNQKQYYLGLKWRSERNFWIAFLTFFSWWILYCFYKLALKRLQLEEELDVCQKQLASLRQSSSTAGDKAPNPEPKKEA